MKLEVGKSYRNRKGERIHIIYYDTDKSIFQFKGNDNKYYNHSGMFLPSLRQHPFDLISLWEEEFNPKRGDRVIVWNDKRNIFIERIFLANIKGATKPIIVVPGYNENKFLNNEEFSIAFYKNMKPIPKEEIIELTIKDISEGKGVGIPPHLIRIKE